ncbi:MAG: hypothetical protein ACRCUY_00505 [Thermoguttaceae bacterium]
MNSKEIIRQLKEWWMGCCCILCISFGIAISTVFLRVTILDYKLELSIELPQWLNNLNPINWITHRILKWTGVDFKYAVWQITQWKWLEVQILSSCEIVAFDYSWTAHSDHWGHKAELTIAGINGHIWFCDSRHWDDDTDVPVSYGNSTNGAIRWRKWAEQKTHDMAHRPYIFDRLMIDMLAEKCAELESKNISTATEDLSAAPSTQIR